MIFFAHDHQQGWITPSGKLEAAVYFFGLAQKKPSNWHHPSFYIHVLALTVATQRYKLSYFQILIFLTRGTSALLKVTPWSCPAKSDLQR